MTLSFVTNIKQSLNYLRPGAISIPLWIGLILLSIFLVGSFVVFCLGVVLVASTMTYLALPELIASGILFATNPVVEVLNHSFAPLGADVIGPMAVGGLGALFIGLLITFIIFTLFEGFTLRIFRGDALNFKHPLKMFGQGFVSVVIVAVYFIPYLIVASLVTLGPMDNKVYAIIVGSLIPTIVLIETVLHSTNAVIRYAKTGFKSAFQWFKISEIMNTHGELRYFFEFVGLNIIVFIVTFVLLIIPVIGIPLFAILLPFIIVFEAKFLVNLYEDGEKVLAEKSGEAKVAKL